MSLYIKLPIGKITNGTIINIVSNLAGDRNYPSMPDLERNKFDIELTNLMNKKWKGELSLEEDKKVEERYKRIKENGEYAAEEARIKEINDLKWDEYMDNLIDWLIVNGYTEMELDFNKKD